MSKPARAMPARSLPARPKRSTNRVVPTRATALLTALLAAAILASDAQGEAHRRAHAARALNVTDTAHLHYARESGLMLVDEGAATGALPGTVRVLFNVGATVSASFTIYTRNGSLAGHGSGTLNEASHAPNHSNVYVSFSGTMTVSRGTGRYAHVHGHGGFYGVIDRHNYAATIQTTGTVSY
jgi:hypothetical protein